MKCRPNQVSALRMVTLTNDYAENAVMANNNADMANYLS